MPLGEADKTGEELSARRRGLAEANERENGGAQEPGERVGEHAASV